MNIAKHSLMVAAVAFYYLTLESTIFMIPLGLAFIVSMLIGMYNLQANESPVKYTWNAWLAGTWAGNTVILMALFVLIAIHGLPDMTTTKTEMLENNWLLSFALSWLKLLLLGPAVLNSYRAYNAWRTASEVQDVRKSKNDWEIPEIIEAQN